LINFDYRFHRHTSTNPLNGLDLSKPYKTSDFFFWRLCRASKCSNYFFGSFAGHNTSRIFLWSLCCPTKCPNLFIGPFVGIRSFL